MKIISAHVSNYRSVDDSDDIDFDDITCLVGKNEAGKTAILTALACLNPHPATPIVLDKERDYPSRFLTDYENRHPDGEATAVATRWEIEPSEMAVVEEALGRGALRTNQATLSRKYNTDSIDWQVSLDHSKIINHLMGKFKLDASERSHFKSTSDLNEFRRIVRAIENPTAKHQQIRELFEQYGTVTSYVISMLSPFLPKFMYFSNYDRMDGAVQVQEVIQLSDNGQIDQESQKGKKLFKEFFEFANVPMDEIVSVSTYETFNARLRAASNNITDQVLEYWSQNPYISVDVRVEAARSGDPAPFNSGTIARARIRNDLHRVDVPFSERSAGFVWFFSFLIKFAQVKDEETPVILLLDEPGLSLHGTAQADLLRYFDEKLAPYHQIIYSTHSPFMVDPSRLSSARIIEDRIDTSGPRPVPVGTKVRKDVLSTDSDTLFPLQGALGYEITQTLFIGKHTLLVEGPSDILYLKALSSAAATTGRTALDPRWTLCPTGGIGNIHAFMGLFRGNKVDVVVLTDYAAGQKGKIESLKKSEILQAGRVLSIHEYTGKAESDIEDLLELDVFADLLNAAYNLKGTQKATSKKLEDIDKNTVRNVQRAEAYFRTEVSAQTPDFDHFAPSEWLVSNPQFLGTKSASVDKTLDRAAELFKTINGLIE